MTSQLGIEINSIRKERSEMKKALIIGSGPAGISASLYLARSGTAEVTIITNGKSSLEKAEKIENYFGFAGPVSGKELLRNGRAGAERLGVRFHDTELLELNITPSLSFEAVTPDGRETFDAVLIAAGAARKAPPIKGLKEFEGRGISYCAVCDAFFYRGKPVAVIGSGEYAMHEAVTLLQTSSSVTVLTNGEEPAGSIPEGIGYRTGKISEIAGDSKVHSVLFEDGSSLSVEGVFVAVGAAGSDDIARKTGIASDSGKIITDSGMATNVPGIYAAGDCTGGLMQISKAVSDGAIAAMSMIRFLKNN